MIKNYTILYLFRRMNTFERQGDDDILLAAYSGVVVTGIIVNGNECKDTNLKNISTIVKFKKLCYDEIFLIENTIDFKYEYGQIITYYPPIKEIYFEWNLCDEIDFTPFNIKIGSIIKFGYECSPILLKY